MRVALDVAREAARRGALEVNVVSLESEREMPAMKSEQGREELEVAREESVSFIASWGPKRIVVRDGKAVGIELVRCVRVFDDSGRFKPEFDEISAPDDRRRYHHPRDRAGAGSFIPQTRRWRRRPRPRARSRSIR